MPGREHSRLRADRRSAPSPSLEIIRSDSLGSDRARVGGAESSIVAGSEAKVSEAEDHAGDEGGDVESDKGHRKQMMEILTTVPLPGAPTVGVCYRQYLWDGSSDLLHDGDTRQEIYTGSGPPER